MMLRRKSCSFDGNACVVAGCAGRIKGRRGVAAGATLRAMPGGGLSIDGLAEVVVEDEAAVERVVAAGTAARQTAATKMNERSSRSHAVLVAPRLSLPRAPLPSPSVPCSPPRSRSFPYLAGARRVRTAGTP